MIKNIILKENPLAPFFWEYKKDIYLKDIDEIKKAQRFIDFWPEIEQLFRKKNIDNADIKYIIKIIHKNMDNVRFENDMIKHTIFFLFLKFKFEMVEYNNV